MSCISTQASVVISPERTTIPVFTSVSQATRALGSCFNIASNIASDIWSATLSGWPSETDSEVKTKFSDMDLVPIPWIKVLRGASLHYFIMFVVAYEVELSIWD